MTFPRGCVASPHHLASEAGLAVLRDGGNALDAAVAVNLTLGVVTPYLCGYGGDLFALVWDGTQLHGYNGSGRAPALATADAVGAPVMPRFGAQTVTVPGAVEGWFRLLERFGSLPFAAVAERALGYAAKGFVVGDKGARSIAAAAQRFADEPEWRSVYGGARAGERLRQPGLARTIETLATAGPDAYYRGPIADAIAREIRARGGFLTREDLDEHAGNWVEPMSIRYRDVDVFELPPNTQGVTALEMLGIVGEEPLPAGDADRLHLLIEAAKLALADRDAFVADPEHMRVDARALLQPAFLAERRALIDPARAGSPAAATLPDGGTAYMCAADANGMIVSLIQSNWMGFGSGITVPGWGINLHNRGNLFSLDPAHVNVLAPRKRPMHTLIPAFAMRAGKPWLAFGTMGGHGQAQTHLQLLARLVDDGAGVAEAVRAPRWLVTPGTWTVEAEAGFAPAAVEELRARGHDVTVVGALDERMGHAHAIRVEPDGYTAAADPRSEGSAAGL